MTLEERWMELWKASRGSGDPHPPLEALMRMLDARRAHVEACFREYDLACTRMTDHRVVGWAIFYHRAIARPGRHDNEARSAFLFAGMAERAQFTDKIIGETFRFILALCEHELRTPGEVDLEIFLDCERSSYWR